MRTHPFDAVSFVFGAIFVAVAVLALTGVAITVLDLRWLAPAVLVVVGAVLIVSAARRDDDREIGSP